MAKNPKWVSPARQAHLVKLFLESGGFCVFGHKPCPYPEHHYELFIDALVKDWALDDRAQSEAQWEAEQRKMHSLGERRYPLRGQFNAIAKDVFYPDQPDYYLAGLGVSGLTFKPFAKVRLSSSYVHLYVNLGDRLKEISKSRRRKAIRYGKALPKEIQEKVDLACRLAVNDWLTH